MKIKSLIKKASLAIKELDNKNKELSSELESTRAELEKISFARELSLKLMKMGAFPIEDFEEHFNKFNEKSTEELETFEKAAELIGAGSFDFNSLGKLSETPSQGSGTAEERFISSLLD